VRRPSRNIEIFSMSVLDMFASALGAFIMVAVILFPYYNQSRQLEQAKKDLEQRTNELQQAAEQVRQAEEVSRRQQEEIRQGSQVQVAMAQCQTTVANCRDKLSRTFVIVAIEWDDPYDVDLFITQAGGREYSWQTRTHPGSEAQLSLDMQTGPGIEVWQNPKADEGTYEVAYSILGLDGSNTVPVKGWVIDRAGGRQPLPERTLKASDTRVRVATVRVNRDGTITINPTTN